MKRFGGLIAVNDVSFDLAAGEILGLIGPNGAGKSSLFNIVTGFVRPEHGTVHFSGNAIQRRPPHRIAEAGLVRPANLDWDVHIITSIVTTSFHTLILGLGEPPEADREALAENVWRFCLTALRGREAASAR